MAAELVVLENLDKILNNEENELLLRAMEELGNLKIAVEWANKIRLALEENDSVRISIGNLVARLYQADDLLDKILYFANVRRSNQATDQRDMLRGVFRRAVNAGDRVAQEVSLFFSSRNQLVLHLVLARQLNKTSQEIIEHAKQLLDEFNSNHIPHRVFELPQSFKLAEHEIIGRDRDRDNIIKMLLRPAEAECRTNISVIPIVGVPGVGKSALAKYVYNYNKVKSHFDLRMWIRISHISENSDEAEIVQEIVESFSSKRSYEDDRNSRLGYLQQRARKNGVLPFHDLLRCQNYGTSDIHPNRRTSRNEVSINERRLQKEIEGKLYLLVLDDASNIHWNHLKDLLGRGAKGSRILVTTRSMSVANLSKTKSVKAYQLKGLVEYDSYTLFKRFAFRQDDPRELELREEGYSIAVSCRGVPLTIKVAASLLYGKSHQYWVSFKNNLMLSMNHENILEHVLHLSYADLPTRLKACFNYCSLFPNDFNYNKHDLISLWNAQGFIDPRHGQQLEEAAEKYFLELSRRCFFEDVSTDGLGNIVSCKMHSIMHKLACVHATGVQNIYVTHSGVDKNLDSASKHISFSCQTDATTSIAPALLQAQHLRTLLSVAESDRSPKLQPLLTNMMVSHFKCLRVLGLHDLGIKELPLSTAELIHLRFLDLSKNDELISLPNSIPKLYNLQTLKLNSCPKLRRLPSNFRGLVNLKRFEIDECDSLTCMPRGLEKLTQIETLSRFVVSKDCSKDMASIGLRALKELQSLRGRLTIELTEDWVTNIPEARDAGLISSKSYLEELQISWEKSVTEKAACQELLEELQPNSNLKSLRIEGYKGEYFPSWAQLDNMLACLPNLVIVSIEGCEKCEHLPPFGELPYLRRLTLRHMANVRHVEGEPSIQSSSDESQEPTSVRPSFFPSLEELILHNFYKLEGWQKEVMITSGQQEAIRSFPRLSKLRISNCPNLRSMPLFMGVSDLYLHNVNQMLLEECANKASMAVKQMLNIRSKINHLQIKGCRNLKSFKAVRKGLGGLPELKQLEVERCDALCSLTLELKHLTSLESLEISSCKELNLNDNGDSATGNTGTISRISNRIVHQFQGVPWASLINLRHLNLREILKMETLPEGLKYVQSLKSLWISACPALRALPEWIGSLTALQHLRIESCQGLNRLPDGLQEVKSLVKVEITECPELMKRCREHTGEDWHKIKHARVLLHKSWRYGLMSELGASQNKSNVQALTDVKYFIVPVIAAEAIL